MAPTATGRRENGRRPTGSRSACGACGQSLLPSGGTTSMECSSQRSTVRKMPYSLARWPSYRLTSEKKGRLRKPPSIGQSARITSGVVISGGLSCGVLRRLVTRLAKEDHLHLARHVERGAEGGNGQQHVDHGKHGASRCWPTRGPGFHPSTRSRRRWEMPAERQCADDVGPERQRHLVPQAAHGAHILRVKIDPRDASSASSCPPWLPWPSGGDHAPCRG